MERIFDLRENLIYYYKKFESYIDFAVKLIFFSIVFAYIFNMDMHSSTFDFVFVGFKSLVFFVACVAFAMIFSTTLTYSLIIVLISLALSNFLVLDIIVTSILICIYLFYIRVAYNENILVLLTIVLAFLKLPYLAGFIVGIFFPITSVLAIFLGGFIYYILNFVKVGNMSVESIQGLDAISIENTIGNLNEVTTSMFLNTDWIYLSIIICAGSIAINLISKLSMKYNIYIAMASGFLIYFIGSLFIVLFTDTTLNFLTLTLSLIFCTVVAVVIQFFSIVLDYDSQEKVQFFDGENYYYVKIVPRYIVKKDKEKRNIMNKKATEKEMEKIKALAKENSK